MFSFANRKRAFTAFAVASSSLLSIGAQAAAELVVNGGFETGDFTGWTTIPAANGSYLEVDDKFPFSGNYAAEFGGDEPPSVDAIEQTIATTPGKAYRIEFYLDHELGTDSNTFVGTFGGKTFISLVNAPPAGYQLFSSVVTTSTAATTLRFAAYNVDFYYTLDDVSVTVVPEPATWVLAASGVALIGLAKRRRPGD